MFAARKEGAGNEEVAWIGDVNALFLDSFGRIREDDGNGALDDGDFVLQFDYDEEANEARVQRYTRDREGNLTASGASFGLTDAEFQPLWSAQEGLRSLASYDVNRSYSDSAANGRYIFTAFDRDGDGQVLEPIWSAANPGQSAGQDGVHAFTKNNFRLIGATENDYRYLGMRATSTQGQVNNLVDFVRGVEGLPGMRSRTLGDQSYLLGEGPAPDTTLTMTMKRIENTSLSTVTGATWFMLVPMMACCMPLMVGCSIPHPSVMRMEITTL